MTIAEDRYRTLLNASSTLAGQPTVKAVLQSLRGVLSSTSRLHGAELYLLNDDGESLYSFEFDRDPDAPAIKRGAKLLRVGPVAQALDEQKPVFIPELSLAMLEHPDMAPFAAEVAGRSAYLFPVSTAQKRYGILALSKPPVRDLVSRMGYFAVRIRLLRNFAFSLSFNHNSMTGAPSAALAKLERIRPLAYNTKLVLFAGLPTGPYTLTTIFGMSRGGASEDCVVAQARTSSAASTNAAYIGRFFTA